MKHLLLFTLLISSLSSFSKLDTNKVLIGTWKLKAIKTEASLRSLDDQVETKSKISSDSLLTIKIKKDSLYKEDNVPSQKIINIENDMKNCQLNVLNQLYNSFKGRKLYLCKGNDAIETLKVINKII